MTNYTKIDSIHFNQLKKLVGNDIVSKDKDVLINYGHDETESLNFPPEILIKPSSVDGVSKIMKYAFENNIPVTPIGARTGLSGGALYIHGGIGISIEKFDKIIEIDGKGYFESDDEVGAIYKQIKQVICITFLLK